jgi:hypothetical protein
MAGNSERVGDAFEIVLGVIAVIIVLILIFYWAIPRYQDLTAKCEAFCSFPEGHYILWDSDREGRPYCLCFNSSSNKTAYFRDIDYTPEPADFLSKAKAACGFPNGRYISYMAWNITLDSIEGGGVFSRCLNLSSNQTIYRRVIYE